MKNKNTKSSTSKDKLPKIGNNKSKSPTQVKGGKNNKSLSKTNSKGNVLKTSANLNKVNPPTSKKEEYNEKRKKRLEQEKKEEARDKKVYEQVLKEFQEKSKSRTTTEANVKNRASSPKSNGIDINNIQLPKIKISEKKTQTILEEGGMLDAYRYLVVQLCKNGLPTGNLFEYSAYVIKNYEKKWKEKKSKMNKEKLEQYWKEKKIEVAKFEKEKQRQNQAQAAQSNKKTDKKVVKNIKIITKEEEEKMKKLNKSLKQREINQLISSMDKSRSSIHHQVFPGEEERKKKKEEEGKFVSVEQKEGKNKGSPKKGNKSKSPQSAKAGKSPQKKNQKSKSKSPSASPKKTAMKNKK